MLSKFHLAKDAFALQLSLQRLQCLVNIIISNKYLHAAFLFFKSSDPNIQRKMLRLDSNALVNVEQETVTADQFPAIRSAGLQTKPREVAG
jgi:hypothetical protein